MNSIKAFFSRKQGQGVFAFASYFFKPKKPSVVMITPAITKKQSVSTAAPATEQINRLINTLRSELLAGKPAPGPAAPNPGATEEERKRREEQIKRKQKPQSAVESKMMDINQEKKYFQVGLQDWQVQQIASKRDYRYRLQLMDYVQLYDTIISLQVKDMYSLDSLDNKTRAIVLAPVVDKKTFDRLVARCWAISGMCPQKSGLHRSQWIASRLDTIVSKRIK